MMGQRDTNKVIAAIMERFPRAAMVSLLVCICGAIACWRLHAFSEKAEEDAKTIAGMQERITTMQKRLADAEDGLDSCQQDLTGQGIAAKAAAAEYLNQLDSCHKSVEAVVRADCGDLCARSYEFAQFCGQTAREMKAIYEEGRRAIEKIESERKAGGKP